MILVVEKKPIPVYQSECLECKSKIRYTRIDIPTMGFINCPVCGSRMFADTTTPVAYYGDKKEEQNDPA